MRLPPPWLRLDSLDNWRTWSNRASRLRVAGPERLPKATIAIAALTDARVWLRRVRQIAARHLREKCHPGASEGEELQFIRLTATIIPPVIARGACCSRWPLSAHFTPISLRPTSGLAIQDALGFCWHPLSCDIRPIPAAGWEPRTTPHIGALSSTPAHARCNIQTHPTR
jgi:hypothetical protein